MFWSLNVLSSEYQGSGLYIFPVLSTIVLVSAYLQLSVLKLWFLLIPSSQHQSPGLYLTRALSTKVLVCTYSQLSAVKFSTYPQL